MSPRWQRKTSALREEVIQIFVRHSPQNLKRVDVLLRKFAGREEIFVRKLKAKYGEDDVGDSTLNADAVTSQLS